MFKSEMEQRVSRSDLRSPEGTPEPEPDAEVIARLKRLSDFDFIQRGDDADVKADKTGDDAEDDQLEFQLFATSKPTAEAANRIRLRSATPPTGDSGFVDPKRPSSYYFASPLSDSEKDNLDDSALSGAQVLVCSQAPWPGSAYPWKVLHLPPSVLTRPARSQNSAYQDAALLAKLTGREGFERKKRTRKGKKTRIQIRTKLTASRNAAKTKEAEEREKRTRRNREKKVKKKAKEKAKKAGEGVTEASGDAAMGGDDEEDG